MTTLPLMLAMPFLGAAAVLLLPQAGGAKARFATALAFTLAALGFLAHATLGWDPAAPPRFDYPWHPSIHLSVSLWLDGPALFWAWLVLGIGACVVWYSGFYMDPGDSPTRFYSSLMAFMGAMLGVVVSENLVMMFVFWEATSITSFLLIGHWSHKPSAIAGARRALLVTGTGGLCLMAGIAVLHLILSQGPGGGTMMWGEVWARADEIAAHPLAGTALLLMLVGAFTKSAQFPFHFWLPGAMEAPTPVSAFLHAATMVKAGIYLLGRIYPVFGGHELWLWIVGPVGVLTMLIGGWMAITAYDIKQLLAFSTVSQLGLIVAYYGFGAGRLGTGGLLTLDLLLVLSHALFKGGLFMMCGVIDHGTHTRDWRRLGGLWRKMPATAALTIIGCASMAGLPLTFGFVAKKLFFDASWHWEGAPGALRLALFAGAVLASCFTMAYCLRVAISPFFGEPREQGVFDHAHEAGPGLLLAPALLILPTLAAGLWVPMLSEPLGRLANAAYYAVDAHYKVGMFKKVDFMFAVSMAIYAAGAGVFFGTGAVDRLQERAGRPAPTLRGYELLFDSFFPWVASKAAAFVAHPSLRFNMAVLAAFFALAVGWPLLGSPINAAEFEAGPAVLLAGLLAASALASLGLVLVPRSAVARVIGMGLVGLIISGFFIFYKAPDLALTQVLVELVVLVMLLILLKRIGAPPRETVRAAVAAPAAAIAVAVALVAGLATYNAASSPDRLAPVLAGNPTHSAYYLANSKYPTVEGAHSGGGNNVVNVILVDFRGLDTLGEITVLVLAALGVALLMRDGGHREFDPSRAQRGPAASGDEFRLRPSSFPFIYNTLGYRVRGGPSIVTRELANIIAVFVLGVALVLFFAGHNAPGGGFIAGLLSAVAVVPFILSSTHEQYERATPHHIFGLIPAGLLFAGGTGLVAMFFGLPFLTSEFWYVHLPLLGEIEIASAMFFDLGVYLVVVGITLVLVKGFGRL
ncbi:MAG: hydrogen gas-evolving membrane-bound hydrogenase subunit E [Candidatus Sumerlaeia bacterium]|nr:hydrogen gas-evolving membrane-bound hydrogenase subunit E [Candidatus Sumerlaeia bacterium]